MKFILAILFFTSTVFAGLPPTTQKGVKDTTSPVTFNVQTPNNSSARVNSTTAYISTKNDNLLKDPDFMDSNLAIWTPDAGITQAVETSVYFNNNKSRKLTTTSQATGSTNTYFQGVTLAQDMTGVNMETSFWFKGALQAGLEVSACVTIDSAAEICSNPYTVGMGNVWAPLIVNFPGADAASFYVSYLKFRNLVSGTTYTGDAYVSSAYFGRATNISSILPPNAFSAKISSAGVVTDQSPYNWISSCSYSSPNMTCTYLTDFFSNTPNCLATTYTPSGTANSLVISSQSSSSVVLQTFLSSTLAASAQAFTLECNKVGADNTQAALSQAQMPGSWSGYQVANTSFTRTNTALGDFSAGTSVSLFKTNGTGISCIKMAGDLPGITCTAPNTGTYLFNINAGIFAGGSPGIGMQLRLVDGSNNILHPGITSQLAGNTYVNAQFLSGFVSVIAGVPFTLKLQGASTSGTLTLYSDNTSWPIVWNLVPISINGGPLYLAGSVVNKSPNVYQIGAATVGGGSSTSACTSSPCTLYNSDGGISSVTRSGTGDYVVNFSPALASSPQCFFTMGSAVQVPHMVKVSAATTSTYPISSRNSANAASDNWFDVICYGAR